MKSGKGIVAATLFGALCLATTTDLSAAESWSTLVMRPLRAVSFDAGAKHVVTYFIRSDEVCKLTVMIADIAGDDGDAKATQLQTSIEPQQTARFATADGKYLRFVCLEHAEAMSATALNMLANSERK
jgi:hypothetical protein